MDFNDLVKNATSGLDGPGFEPYPYQRRLAEEGLPELLDVPTGAGKTVAAVLPWLYRRRFHDSDDVRASTPHWLVIALPMRVLVEQTHDQIESWLQNLGLGDHLPVHLVMGGDGKLASEWRLDPNHDAIFVGTIDMLLSRALNRGYGESRWVWPVDFGLFNSGCQWVFDEVQLMGPALPTSLQLDGLRTSLGCASPSRSMWMSATVDEQRMSTFDKPGVAPAVRLSEGDTSSALSHRLEAEKKIREIVVDSSTEAKYLQSLSAEITARHRPGALTIVILNTVSVAVGLHKSLSRSCEAELVLVHSRFRPGDRSERVAAALANIDRSGAGRVVVSPQVLVAGVDSYWHGVLT